MPTNPQLREQRAGVDEAMPRNLIHRYFQSLYGMAMYGMAKFVDAGADEGHLRVFIMRPCLY